MHTRMLSAWAMPRNYKENNWGCEGKSQLEGSLHSERTWMRKLRISIVRSRYERAAGEDKSSWKWLSLCCGDFALWTLHCNARNRLLPKSVKLCLRQLTIWKILTSLHVSSAPIINTHYIAWLCKNLTVTVATYRGNGSGLRNMA
jgi:hypothetical protein